MDKIDIKNIELLQRSKQKIIKFSDGINKYSFSIKDSQLSKYFKLSSPVDSFDFSLNKKDLDYYIDYIVNKPKSKQPIDSVVLKLYSERLNEVAEKSGLNQSYADGRARHPDEVYIPIPIAIHRDKPQFFSAKA